VTNGVLLRPLPYPEADRIMRLRQLQTLAVEDTLFSCPEVAHYRSQSETIDQSVEFGDWTFNVLGRGAAHRVVVQIVCNQKQDVQSRWRRLLLVASMPRDGRPVGG
jgi:hypothetical protein